MLPDFSSKRRPLQGWPSIELAVIEHSRNPTVLARHKEGIYADKVPLM
jgi:hypothetical protein